MNEHYYERNGIVVHMYRPIMDKKFYLTEEGYFVEDRNQAVIWCFENVNKFNEWLEENILEIYDTYGDSVRFEKRKRFTPIKKGGVQ